MTTTSTQDPQYSQDAWDRETLVLMAAWFFRKHWKILNELWDAQARVRELESRVKGE